jgi:transcriptional regulator with XRE-family HTH domain
MSVRGFAAYLGVSHRAVSKWEAAGHRLTPRLETQAMLDTALGRATIDALARFELALSVAPALGSAGTSVDIVDSAFPVITQEHPVDSKLMTLIPAGDFLFGATDERRTLGASDLRKFDLCHRLSGSWPGQGVGDGAGVAG